MTSTARIVTETKNNRQNTELNYTKKKNVHVCKLIFSYAS